MGWKGATIGCYLGSVFGGPFGAVLGAMFGHKIESLRGRRQAHRRTAQVPPRTPDEYAVIGASVNDSDETLKRKYRELVKKCHPDALRARGISEDKVGEATERMSRINAAWATIKAARGL